MCLHLFPHLQNGSNQIPDAGYVLELSGSQDL